jgi:hypothetical protein
MRRTIPFVVAVMATIAAVLAVMVGVGIGQPVSSHGGTPTDVYTQTLGSANDEVCADVPADGVSAMPQEFEVASPSQVVAVFSFSLEGLDARELAVAHLELDGAAPGVADTWFTTVTPKISVVNGTLTWSFPNVLPGQPHTVSVYAAVQAIPGRSAGTSDLVAQMMNCALTVLVSPVVE